MHTWMKVAGPQSPDPLATKLSDEDRSRVATHVPSYQLREEPTQPVIDRPTNGHD